MTEGKSSLGECAVSGLLHNQIKPGAVVDTFSFDCGLQVVLWGGVAGF